MKFRATLEQSKKTATGIEVPADVLTGLDAGKRPKVRARLNGYEYRTSVGSMDGRAMLPVSAEVRAAAGLTAGDEVEVELVVDTEPRVVEVPADLADALEAAGARAAFDKLSYSQQRRYTLAIADAKTDATRQRRIAKAVDELSG